MVDKLRVGIMQRNFPLRPETVDALAKLSLPTTVIDSSPVPVVSSTALIRVVHAPDAEGFYPIYLLKLVFADFLRSDADRLLLLEGDLVPDEHSIDLCNRAEDNTKIFYRESDPDSPHAYIRREGLAGVLMRTEVSRIHGWMKRQSKAQLRTYAGYCDTFLWYAVRSETSGYSLSTAGAEWIPMLHITHDDRTRVTKKQRADMKQYRTAMAEVIALAMRCNAYAGLGE